MLNRSFMGEFRASNIIFLSRLFVILPALSSSSNWSNLLGTLGGSATLLARSITILCSLVCDMFSLLSALFLLRRLGARECATEVVLNLFRFWSFTYSLNVIFGPAFFASSPRCKFRLKRVELRFSLALEEVTTRGRLGRGSYFTAI